MPRSQTHPARSPEAAATDRRATGDDDAAGPPGCLGDRVADRRRRYRHSPGGRPGWRQSARSVGSARTARPRPHASRSRGRTASRSRDPASVRRVIGPPRPRRPRGWRVAGLSSRRIRPDRVRRSNPGHRLAVPLAGHSVPPNVHTVHHPGPEPHGHASRSTGAPPARPLPRWKRSVRSGGDARSTRTGPARSAARSSSTRTTLISPIRSSGGSRPSRTLRGDAAGMRLG